MRTNNFVTKKKLAETLYLNFKNIASLKGFITALNNETDVDNRENILFHIGNEDLPVVSNYVRNDVNNIKNVKEDKQLSLFDYILAVNVVKDDTNKISYASYDNLDTTINSMLNDSRYSNLNTFLSPLLSGINHICKEFLQINGILPYMVSTNRIIIYSNLLNYPKNILDVNNVTEINGITIGDEWDTVRYEFINFLMELP